MLAHRRLGRHDVERLVQQVRTLEAQSGRPAVSVQIDVPPYVDPLHLETALREMLGTSIDIDVHTDPASHACRVVTVDFAWLGREG